MNVLDLFAGTKGFSQAFEDREHNVFSIEINEEFSGISLYKDVLEVTKKDIPFVPDCIVSSPVCTSFTLMACRHYWIKNEDESFTARNEKATRYLNMVEKSFEIMSWFPDAYNFTENPRACLRKFPIMNNKPRFTIWQCRYGKPEAKPTDIWGNFPTSWKPRMECYNGHPDHVAAPRGSQTGSQGKGSVESARIPYAFSEEICIAVEEDLK